MLRRKPAAGAPDSDDTLQHSASEGDLLLHVGETRQVHPAQASQQQQQTPALLKLASPFALGLLCTGSSLALLSQLMASKGVSMPQAQIPAWTKYTSNFVLSALLEGASGSSGSSGHMPLTRKQAVIMVVMGLLDVMGYGLSCIAFTKCGAALTMVLSAASGQICTAMTRLLILHRKLTLRQSIAVAIVTIGLVLRGLGAVSLSALLQQGTGGWAAASSSGTLVGVLLIALSSLCYSLLGVGYEWLVQAVPGRAPSQAQINSRMSVVGAVAVTAYQVAYTWPRRQELIYQPLQLSGVAGPHLVLLYVVFGGIFTAHSHLQGKMLGLHGAMSVGIVNATRAVVVSVASAALFCRAGSTSQCLTFVSGSSAVLVTLGALLWATSPAAQHGRLAAPQLKALPSYSNLLHLPQQLSSDDLQSLKKD